MVWSNRKDGQPARVWSTAERALLLKQRADGLAWEVISASFPGSTPSTCEAMWKLIRWTAVRANAPAKRSPDTHLDRERRRELSYARTDVTATFFNDPLPGYSALDRRSTPAGVVASANKPSLYWGARGPEAFRT